MKTKQIWFTLLLFLLGLAQLHASITVRISVKFILKPDGTRPDVGNLGSVSGFDQEISRGNAILDLTGRGYRLQVVEYLDIQPPVPAGSNSSYWFNLDARANRATIETAALADQTTWKWNPNSINIYINNSSSGQCSFPGSGYSISLGNDIGTGTVLHEIGHFFNLSHTHAGDYTDNSTKLPFTAADLKDGDGLPETANDNPNIYTHDQLCVALFMTNYSSANFQQQAIVDSAYENVMSYHNENRLLPVQMDIWTRTANKERLPYCTGRTWFVSLGGSDSNAGTSLQLPFSTVGKALTSVSSPDDVILLQSGNFSPPPGRVITTRCTFCASGGPVTLR